MQKQDYKNYQDKLARIRIAKNITQIELAERIGKPQSYVSKYESGERRLDIAEFLEICKMLSTDVNDIIMEHK